MPLHALAQAAAPADTPVEHEFWQAVHDTGQVLVSLVWEHVGTLLGFALALLVMGRLFLERRNPSNIFAWGFFILIIPWLGVPLYFLFGGRKSKRLATAKMRVSTYAAQLAAGLDVAGPPPQEAPPLLSARRRFGYNSFHLLGDGMAAYEVLRREIAQARRSIYLQTFILGRDEYARQIVADLAARAREGIEVKLLLDAFGSWTAKGRFSDPVRKAGGRVGEFMPMLPLATKTSANLRNHRKYAIFDRERSLVGGQNIDRRFIASRDEDGLFLDFSALIEGPVVAVFNRAFVSDWCFATGDSPAAFKDLLAHRPESRGPHQVEVMSSGPDVDGDPLWERLLTLVQQGEGLVTVVTPYFIPDEVLFRSMLVRAHLGRGLRIIVPYRSNHPIADFARHHYLRQLHEAGVEILLYQPKMIHAKLVLVDKQVALIGSANIDMRSLFVNFEIGVFLYSPEPIRDLTEWTERLRPGCVSYLASGHAGAGANRRLMEDFAHLLGPLL